MLMYVIMVHHRYSRANIASSNNMHHVLLPAPILSPPLPLSRPPQAQLLISLVPYCRSEPDGAKCRELYELLSDFLSKGNVDAHALCAALPALHHPPPPTPSPPSAEAPVVVAGDINNNGDGVNGGGGGVHADMDGPLPGPASNEERELTSTAVAALSAAVAADGVPALAPAMPLLVWLMRLIVEPRITPSDEHLSGLLRLTRIIVGWLGPQGKEAVGLWGLEGIGAGGEGGGEEGGGRPRGLLHHVYHECLFDIATHDNHGPLAPPKCRWGFGAATRVSFAEFCRQFG